MERCVILSIFLSFYSLQRSVDKSLPLFLDEGHWFVSLYNDYGDGQKVGFLLVDSPRERSEGCPRGCNSPIGGECVLGRCNCKPGYGGEDCSSQGKRIYGLPMISFTFF